MNMLQASKHQGHSSYKGSGRQCVANSLMSIWQSYHNSPADWVQQTMDNILDSGDKLYREITLKTGNAYISLEEIPEIVHSMTVTKSIPFCGTLNRELTEEPFYAIEDALLTLCHEAVDHECFLITMGNAEPAYTSAIIKKGSIFYFFDPHSRSVTGNVTADGHATMTTYCSIADLCFFIKNLASSLFNGNSDSEFEIVQITMSLLNEGSDLDSDFSGFSSVSEGEITCRLFLAQESLDSEFDVSESEASCSSFASSLISNTINDLNESATLIDSIDVNAFDTYKSGDEDNIPLIYLVKKGQQEQEHADEQNKSNHAFNDLGSEYDYHNAEDNTDLVDDMCEFQDNDKNDNLNDVDVHADNCDDQGHGDDNHIPDGNNNQPCVVSHTQNENCNSDNEVKRGRGRKRTRNPSAWQRNVNKQRRNEGKSYVSRTGNVRTSRVLKKGCGSKCRYRCHENFNESEREKLFHCFWQIGDITKQRNFVSKYALKKLKLSQTTILSSSRRQNSIQWTLPKQLENGPCTIQKVCKTFFLDTLDLTPRFVKTVHMKQTLIGMCDNDKRGKHISRPNKLPEEQLEQVRSHIESFKLVDSHYCRKDSQKQYLPSNLSLSKMYNLYKEYCLSVSVSPVQIHIYRRIFNNEYNLAFHRPLKDQCDLCCSYKNGSPTQKDSMETEYSEHIRNKNVVNKLKLCDKETSRITQNVCAACFDMEQILLTPHSFESTLYYKRRLSTYNFTIYDLGTKEGYCYIWNETTAKRGGSEVSSCILSFIEEKRREGIREFIFYSDNCQGHNKNRHYVTMMWYCIKKYDLISITHRYLEKGHTFNENDSIHASIENVSRNIKIFTTSQWAATVRAARYKKPYQVKEMLLSDFYDFKGMSEKLKNFDYNSEDEKVYWNKIRSFYISSSQYNIFEYKTDHDGQYKQVDLMKRSRNKIVFQQMKLEQLRLDQIPLSREKYADLLNLCQRNIIPRVHHAFYLFLPHD